MILIPRRDYIVVKVDEPDKEKKTASGIVLTTKASNEDRQQIAEVIAVGEGIFLENGNVLPLGIKVGEKVLINKYAGTEIKLDGETYILLHDKDIIATIQ